MSSLNLFCCSPAGHLEQSLVRGVDMFCIKCHVDPDVEVVLKCLIRKEWDVCSAAVHRDMELLA